jgi:hypothetical protein
LADGGGCGRHNEQNRQKLADHGVAHKR